MDGDKLTFDEILLWNIKFKTIKDYIHPPEENNFFDRAQTCIAQTLRVCKMCAITLRVCKMCAAPSRVMHAFTLHAQDDFVRTIFSYDRGSGYDDCLP